jgi:hypothetical protein
MASSQRLVLDFDCTLSEHHLWKTTHGYSPQWSPKVDSAGFGDLSNQERLNSPAFAMWIMGGQERVNQLKSSFEKLAAAGVLVEICTWSESNRVLKILTATGMDGLISRIHGRTEDGSYDCDVWTPGSGWSKETELTEKREWLLHMAPDNVLFVDDTANNYNGLEPTIHCFDNTKHGLLKDSAGLTLDMMQAIEEHFLPAAASASIPSIEQDLSGNRFSLKFLTSVVGEDVVGFSHDPSTVCIQAGSHSALLRLEIRSKQSGEMSHKSVFLKKVIDIDYAHKSWVDRKRLLMYIRNEVRFYTEFSDAVQGSRKCLPTCFTALQHNIDTLETQEEGSSGQGQMHTGAIMFLEPIKTDSGGYYQRSPLTVDEVAQSLRALAAFHAAGWEKVPLLSQMADRLFDHAGSYTLQNRNPNELLKIEGNWAAFVNNFRRLNPDLFAREEIVSLGKRLSAVAKDVAGRLEIGPNDKFATIQHGDYKSMNIFLHKSGLPDDVLFIDFASTGVGYGMADVAMHIIHALHPKDKQNGIEEQLVDVYLKALEEHGVTGFDRESALELYDYSIIDYARFMFGRFYGESSTPENFEKRKDNMNTSFVNRNVDAAFAFSERVHTALKRVERLKSEMQ